MSVKFHGMTLPENTHCPDRERFVERYVGDPIIRGACGLHQGYRHLRFARAKAVAGNFRDAVKHLTSAFFLLGNYSRDDRPGRDRAWRRLVRIAHRVEAEVVARIPAKRSRRRRMTLTQELGLDVPSSKAGGAP